MYVSKTRKACLQGHEQTSTESQTVINKCLDQNNKELNMTVAFELKLLLSLTCHVFCMFQKSETMCF